MFEDKEVRVILANAGTGKTTRLIELIAKELKTRRPEEIAFVTFTRKGAEEGLSRICTKYMYTPEDLPYFRTLHSLTFHALNLKSNQMFGRLDQRKFNKEYGYSLNRCEVSTGKVYPSKDSQYLDFYDLERSGALTSDQLAEADIEMSYYHQLVQDYENYKSQQCLVDFFDCLIKYVQAGETLPVKVVFIDEAQDITALQWQVIDKAFSKAEKVYIAGDENQSIFSYSGARPDYLIKFAQQFPVEYLSASYRIPRQVYNLARGVMSFISEKTKKPFDFKEGNAEGNVFELNTIDRLKNFIEPVTENKSKTQWYILARNKCFLTSAATLLEENLIPYWTSEGFFMDGEIMRRLCDYEGFKLEGYKNETKKEQFRKKFGIENFALPFTETNLFTEERKWIYKAYIEKYGLNTLKEMCKWTPQILLSTIHFVKGGEADNVALLLDTTRKTKSAVFKNLDEELRVLYVGITRAKRNLYLIDSSSGDGFDSIIQAVKNEYHLTFN